MHLDSIFTVFLEHQALQESSKTTQKALKRSFREPPSASEKVVHFWTPFLAENDPQNSSKSGPEIAQKPFQKLILILTQK